MSAAAFDCLQDCNIAVAPHDLVVDGGSCRDGTGVQPGDFYRRSPAITIEVTPGFRAHAVPGVPGAAFYVEAEAAAG